MNKRLVAVVMLSLLTLNVAALVYNVRPVMAAGTIYIRSDGRIEPEGAPITTADNVTYLLTNNTADSIVIERSSILFHGNAFSVQGLGSGDGISLSSVSNVTIEDTTVTDWANCVFLFNTSYCSILKNRLGFTEYGILAASSFLNIISENRIDDSTCAGIQLAMSSDNNTVLKNDIETNYVGILVHNSSGNRFSRNNLINNSWLQVYFNNSGFPNAWDEGYPWCGNYWSDYNGTDFCSGPSKNETDPDGVGDTAYSIDAYNVDSYPLMNPWNVNFTIKNHMVIAYADSPSTLDPARSYSFAGLELMMNVYETLISFDEEKTDQFVPRIATNWEISPDGLTYTFNIREGVKFHNGENLTAEDVEYSLERMLVIEASNGPAWLFYQAFFNTYGSQHENGTITGQQIDDAITRNGTAVALHLVKPYPPFIQVLAQAYSSILCKKWCIQIGDWPGTFDNWTLYNRPEKTAIENQTSGPPGPRTDAMCGTGPFMLDFCAVGIEWQLLRFNDYWRGWPALGASGSLRRVTAKIISDAKVRADMLLDGRLDHATIPRTAINEVLGQPRVRSIYPLEDLSCSAILFTFNISTTSQYMGVPGGLPSGTLNESGIPPDFFTDIDVRKGFAYAFNYSQLIAEALLGEANQPATPILPGLPFYNPTQEKYSTDMAKANQYFAQAWNGQLWASGFNFTISYNPGNIARQKTCEIIKATIESLNPKFHIQVRSESWTYYIHTIQYHEAPIFLMGWLADYADPHTFAQGFMQSSQTFPVWQAYSNSTIDALVEEGISTLNETARRETYYELQMLYHEDCPGVPLYQPLYRRFERTWVQGWVYNPLVQRNYFYVQWKADTFPSTRYSWNMFHHDAAHTGYAEGPAPETNRTQWTYTVTAAAIDSSPAVVDGKVYFGSTAVDGTFYCFDAYNGTQVWNCSIGDMASSPAVAYGKVYIASRSGELYCFDALSGEYVWSFSLGSVTESSPTVADGRVFLGANNSVMHCFDAFTGFHIWNFSTTGGITSVPAVVGDYVYFGSGDRQIYCLSVFDGMDVWNRTTSGSVISSPAVVNGKVYVGSSDGSIYCFGAYRGTLEWNKSLGAGAQILSSPAVVENRVFVGSSKTNLHCLDALSGGDLWNFTTDTAIYSSPAVAEGKVYFVSYLGMVYCLNASTGLQIWSYYIARESQASSPAIADGMVFVGSASGTLYAFGNVIRVPEDYGTIQAAIDAADPGATIWIAPGIYNESLVIDKPIRLIGKIGSEPIFKCGGSGIAIRIEPTASGTVVAGFVITNWDQGFLINDASNCQIYDNVVSLMNQNGITLQGTQASNNLICYNIFEQSPVGVDLTSSSTNNYIHDNIIKLSGVGLLVESSGNVIYANIITENTVPISIKNSDNNKFYHNDFMANDMPLSISASTGNVWDDGYPSGGNYWVCHVSVDNCNGTDQKGPVSDGIVDVPYTIATGNIDNYPLLKPFSLHNVGITSFINTKAVVGQSCKLRVHVKLQNLGMYDETFTFILRVNNTLIQSQTISISRRDSSNLLLTWTANLPVENYTLTIQVGLVPDEVDISDNTFSCHVIVTIPGDLTGNAIVDIFDAITLSGSYGIPPGTPGWNGNADINEDDCVDIFDAIILSGNYGTEL